MLTGHNPPDYNGFKIVIAGDTLANEQIQVLRKRSRPTTCPAVSARSNRSMYWSGADRSDIAKPMKVVVRRCVAIAHLGTVIRCLQGRRQLHQSLPRSASRRTWVDLIAKGEIEKADLAWPSATAIIGVVTPADLDRLLMLFAGRGFAQSRRRHHLRRQNAPAA